MSQYFCAVLLSLFATQAFASQDCRQEAKDAIDDCNTIAQSAEQANSDVASGVGAQPENMAHGGGNLADTSNWGRNNLAQASSQCKTDFDTCKKACGEAFSNATNPTIQKSIIENLNTCKKQITASQDRLSAGQQSLASATQDSRTSALNSGDSEYRDQQIDKQQFDAPVQQAETNLDAIRRLQGVYGTGSYASGGNEIRVGPVLIPAGPGDALRTYTGSH